MAFKKYMRAEKIVPTSDQETNQIRQIVASASKKSAAELTDQERNQLPK